MRLRELFEAEKAATDPAKRASIHREAVEYIKARQDDKNEWAIALSAIAQYVPDPVAEFGDSTDPFEKWLLASVLYFKHQPLPAAKYFTEAADTGHYPEGLQVRGRHLLFVGPDRSRRKAGRPGRHPAGQSRRAVGLLHAVQASAPAMGAQR